MKLTVRDAIPEDATTIILRQQDRIEAAAWAPGVPVEVSLREAIRGCDGAITALEGDTPVLIAGASGTDFEVHPWLMCSVRVSAHGREVLEEARSFIEALQLHCPGRLICNHVYRANNQAKRFLKALGFRIVPSPGNDKFDFFYLP